MNEEKKEFPLDAKVFHFLKRKQAEGLQIQAQVNGALQLIAEQENLQGPWSLDWDRGVLVKTQQTEIAAAPPNAAPQKTNGVDKQARA